MFVSFDHYIFVKVVNKVIAEGRGKGDGEKRGKGAKKCGGSRMKRGRLKERNRRIVGEEE